MGIPEGCMSIANRDEWRAWLNLHHSVEQQVWLFISRKGSARRFLVLEDAVEEALCFGWIDGLLRPIDKETYALRFSPRKPGSVWSVNNQRRVEKLIREGQMTPAGLKKVAEAKENGEWEATTTRERVGAVPDDLIEALQRDAAWVAFENWSISQKKQYLYWLESAKKPETREKRIQAIVKMAQGKQS